VSGSEWHGEPHALIVHAATPPDGPFDDGELEYDLEHPPSCEQEERDGGHYTEYTCDVAHEEGECGLAYSLRYSGTPVTEPGTYRIQGWGRKTYDHYNGAYEYDGAVGVMDSETAQ
jgi:hypothetical protein